MMPTNSRQSLLGFSFFDFANSGFTLIFHAYLFPLYLKEFVFDFDKQQNSDLWWGMLLSGSALLALTFGPLVGRLADSTGRWKIFAAVASFSFASALGLSVTIGNHPVSIIVMFMIANGLFYLAANLYDSLLNSLASGNNKPAFSGFAWGFGYLGGIVCLAVVFLLQKDSKLSSQAPYLFTSLFYTVCGLVSLVLLRRPLMTARTRRQVTFRELLAALTIDRLGLLLGYFLVADVIGAVIAFTSLYASEELQLSTNVIGGFLLGVQLLAVPFTYLVCRAAIKLGAVRTLGCCVVIWMAILLLFVVKVNVSGMLLVTLLTALVIGSTQALMRSHYSDLLENGRDSELFGWYGIATESASVISPLLFGLASATLASKRIAMGLLVIPLCVGFWLLARYSERLSDKIMAKTSPTSG